MAELTPGSSAPGPDLAVLGEEKTMLFAAGDVSHLSVDQLGRRIGKLLTSRVYLVPMAPRPSLSEDFGATKKVRM